MSYCTSSYVVWISMGMFIIHFTMPKNLIVILENKKVSQDNIRQWPICNGQENIYFGHQLF
jgi:hypothetical protein